MQQLLPDKNRQLFLEKIYPSIPTLYRFQGGFGGGFFVCKFKAGMF